MKVVLLAGGFGTRIAEESGMRPKPMVEIGGKPLLWHIMNIYSARGFDDFVVACGYKGEYIKEYFRNFFLHHCDLTIDLKTGSCDASNCSAPKWRITLIDTGLQTQTGGRLRRLKDVLPRETFMVTYGDGVSNINVCALAEFHRSHGRLATVTAVRPPARFGGLVLSGNQVKEFTEKSQLGEGWINGGFFVFEPEVLDYLEGDETVLERDPLERLARKGELMAFRHPGFWQPMDTLREKQMLEALWESGSAPWKVWA
jgi:glucose-1-phosphate cytidylyltransferase